MRGKGVGTSSSQSPSSLPSVKLTRLQGSKLTVLHTHCAELSSVQVSMSCTEKEPLDLRVKVLLQVLQSWCEGDRGSVSGTELLASE